MYEYLCKNTYVIYTDTGSTGYCIPYHTYSEQTSAPHRVAELHHDGGSNVIPAFSFQDMEENAEYVLTEMRDAV